MEIVPDGFIGIYDIDDLYGIRNDLSANYILMKDIDMSEDTAEGSDWNLTGHGWTPIDGFKGTFDGNGHRIIGMVISRTTNTLKDGTKKKIVYYACGSWKNKGTAVCYSNAIRVEKANRVVFHGVKKFY